MDKPKILIFHHSGAIGGGGVSMLHILESMDQSAYDMVVYCPSEPNDMFTMVQELGIKAVGEFNKGWVYPHYNGAHYKTFDPRYTQAVQYIEQSKDHIKTILESEKPDVLILNSVTLVWMAEIAKGLGVKVIVFDRETLPAPNTDKRTRAIINAMHDNCDAVAFLSDYDAAFCGYHGDNQGYVIHDRVDVKLFDAMLSREDACGQLGLDKDSKYVLFMGGVWPIKGTHVIVEAMKDIDAKLIFLQYEPKEKKINLSDRGGIKGKLRYVLGMDYEANIINMIDKHGLLDKIHFAPSQKDVRPWFAACDVVVFPSTLPHQSRPTYEAGFAKRPVVVSDFSNTEEFAKDEENALTFKPEDARDLARQVNRLLHDAKLTERLVINNEKKSRAEHDLETLPAALSHLIENTLKGEKA